MVYVVVCIAFHKFDIAHIPVHRYILAINFKGYNNANDNKNYTYDLSSFLFVLMTSFEEVLNDQLYV